MQINARFNLKATDALLKNHGLHEGGPVQKFIDQECIRLMEPYTPNLNEVLIKSATLGTKIGSGKICQSAPYARYQYYGKLMVSSVTGSAYAKQGEKKVLTATDLKYSLHKSPKAGKMWFERMVADNKEKILEGAQQVASRGN